MVFRKKNINFSGDMNGQQLKSSRPLAEERKRSKCEITRNGQRILLTSLNILDFIFW